MKETFDFVQTSLKALRAVVLACVVAGGLGATTTALAAETSSAGYEKVSINTADADTLAATLRGIGASKAQAIVDWRQTNGNFQSLDELTNVKGIGQATIDKNRDKLTL